jgi:hypothetical protein
VAGASFHKVSVGKKNKDYVIRVRFNAPLTAQILLQRQDLLNALSVHMACEYLREALPKVLAWSNGESIDDRNALFANSRNWAPSAGYAYMGQEYLAGALEPVVFVALLAGERGVDEAVLSAILPRDLQSLYSPSPPWLRLLAQVEGAVFGGVEPGGLFPLETRRVCVRAGVPESTLVDLLTNGLQSLSFRLAQLFCGEI